MNYELLFKTKPIYQNLQMFVKLVKSRNYNYEQRTMNYELLFKTNPIKPNFKRHTCSIPGTPNGGQVSQGSQIKSFFACYVDYLLGKQIGCESYRAKTCFNQRYSLFYFDAQVCAKQVKIFQ
jgi:hypothetical protein